MPTGDPKPCTNCIEEVRKLFNCGNIVGGWPKVEAPPTGFSDRNRTQFQPEIPVTKENLKQGIAAAIKILESFRDEINDQNCSEFNVFVSEHRDLDPIRGMSRENWGIATGFKQISPLVLDIRIEDRRKEGKELGGNNA
jgi:hypothetical protein